MNSISNISIWPNSHTHDRQVIVGFSGGADSTALLLLLKEQGFAPQAVHFHHGLRTASNDEEKFCYQFCQKHKIDLRVEALNVPQNSLNGESIEEAARRLRLKFWQRHYPKTKFIIALAHHKSDKRENFILRFLRGSNTTGLTGLRSVTHIGDSLFWRPLLENSPQELKNYLQSHNQGWCEDESNNDLIFARNSVRHQVIPALEKSAKDLKGLDRCLERLEEEATFLEGLASDYTKEPLTKEILKKSPLVLRPRIWSQWLRQQGDDGLLRHETILRLNATIERDSQEDSHIPIGRGRDITFVSNGTIVFKQPVAEFSEVKWCWRREASIEIKALQCKLTATLHMQKPQAREDSEIFSVRDLAEEITIRRYCEGQRMVPFGKSSTQKISKIFNKAKIPASLRHLYPVLFNEEAIFWLAPIKRAEFGRCQESEKEWLEISCERL